MIRQETKLLVTLEVSVRSADERSVQEAIKALCNEGVHVDMPQAPQGSNYSLGAKRKPVAIERVYMDQRGAVVEGKLV